MIGKSYLLELMSNIMNKLENIEYINLPNFVPYILYRSRLTFQHGMPIHFLEQAFYYAVINSTVKGEWIGILSNLMSEN